MIAIDFIRFIYRIYSVNLLFYGFIEALGTEQWFFLGAKKRTELFSADPVFQKKFPPFFTPLSGGRPP